MIDNLLCTNPKDLPDLRWVAKLSNGITVWQDDKNRNSWKDLKQYVESNNLDILSLHLEFRSHIIPLTPSLTPVIGYYFNKGGRAGLGSNVVQNCYIVGVILSPEQRDVFVKFYMTPELEVASTDFRNIEQNQQFIIFNASTRPNR